MPTWGGGQVIIIIKYRLKKGEAGEIHVVSHEINVCPVCGHTLIVIGTRKRGYIDTGDRKQTLIIRRLRCENCRTIHHELPDIIMPYKRHCADTVEKIIGGREGEVCCEEGTIQRIRAWWAACRVYFEGVLRSQQEKYGVIYTGKETPGEIVRAVANAHLWQHTRSAVLSG